jgi:hypothetical protein
MCSQGPSQNVETTKGLVASAQMDEIGMAKTTRHEAVLAEWQGTLEFS